MTLATDETQEAVAVREVITAHSVFPTCVCLVGLALFDLLEDSETHNGSTGLLLSPLYFFPRVILYNFFLFRLIYGGLGF